MMQKRIILTLGFATLTVLSSILQPAIGDTVVQTQPKVMADSGTVSLTITSSKSVFNVSDPILVSLALINTSKKRISYEERGFLLKEFQVSVTDSANHPVSLTRYGQAVRDEELPTAVYRDVIRLIAPGYEAQYHFWLNRQYDMTLPGIYHVIISRSVTDDQGQVISLASTPTTITVVEPVNVFNKDDNNLEVPVVQKIPDSSTGTTP